MSGGGGTLKVERTKRGKASKRKKMKRVGFTLDMTPLVDITFLLLTFFMFTTTMATPQVMEMSIPPESRPVEVRENELLTLRLAESGKLFWNIAKDAPQLIDIRKLRALAVKENLKPDVRNKLITVLKVDGQAPYGLVVNILDELNLAEMNITAEIAKDKDKDGNPMKRQRRFTIAPMSDEDLKEIEGVSQK